MNIYALFALLNGALARFLAPLRDGQWVLLFVVGTVASLFVLSIQDLPDVPVYKDMFQNTPALWAVITDPSVLASIYGEPGYLVANSVIKTIYQDYGVFRFIVVFAALALKLWVIRRLSPNYAFAVFFYFALFFYFDSFVLRQSLAAALIGVALYCLFRGHRAWFVLWSLLAASFHVSALCVLPLYFFIRFDPSRLLALTIVVAALALGAINVGNLMIDLVIQYSGFDYISRKLIRYTTSAHSESLGLFRGSTMLYTLALLCFAALRPWLRDRLRYYPQILVVCLYAYLLFVGFNSFGIMGDRLFRLFGLFFCVVFASFSLCINRDDRFVFAVAIIPISVLVLFAMSPDLLLTGL
ncbi:EpsG family protein [Marinobacter sp. TBZ242]|uniref:EpsG family protein n=1 Tax=Marinobacter azerbaijanicus TaxID=3050455 RepID=A0ABT7I7M5_9GAMM|nr:EpsG family protein [Marinobacter sp. TBZ242]MDL0430162.1 EpsG family protein [Marinobacter sp. TBZ242]